MTVTQQTSGIPAGFITKIAQVAQTRKCFIMIRPVNKLATALLEGLVVAKGLDIHGKSADWGPMAGFIPCDSSLSKLAGGDSEAIDAGTLDNESALSNAKIGKKALTISVDRLAELRKAKLVPNGFSIGGECTWTRHDPGGKSVIASKKFKLTRLDGGELQVQIEDGDDWQDVCVMGYQMGQDVSPVTADLDLFAVCPHYSATTAIACQTQNKDGQGFITPYEEKTLAAINQACGTRIVLHGAENHNTKYVQAASGSTLLAVFCPNGQTINVPLPKFARVAAALLRRGYVCRVNPSWGNLKDQLIDVRGTVSSKLLSPQTRGDITIPQPLLKAHFDGKAPLAIGTAEVGALNLDAFLRKFVKWTGKVAIPVKQFSFGSV